jgi:SagB-type dehydrogenase family enzyme
MLLEEALLKRRSVRSYANIPVTIGEISQLLWAAQGITNAKGNRTAPSAGACYPLDVYLVVGNADSLLPGLYRYLPKTHQVEMVSRGDIRESISAAALGQKSVRSAPATIAIIASYEKIDSRYKDRKIRYADMEAGHVGQNISLQAVALGLGTVMVGAFDDRSLKAVLNLGHQEVPLYLIPVGKAENKKAR